MELNWNAIRLVEKLKKQSKDLYDYVYNACVDAATILENIKCTFDEYTDHSSKHSLAVLKIGDELTENINLNKWEISIYILSCYYHDIGMSVGECEKKKLVSHSEYKKTAIFLRDQIVSDNQLSSSDPDLIDKFLFLEYIRRNHAKRSGKWIKNNRSKENEDSYICGAFLWDKVALVAEAHGIDLNEVAPNRYCIDDRLTDQNENINMLFLACLLRLSDYCHMNQNRALPYLRLAQDFYSKKSENIWKKLANVDFVKCDNANNKIVVSASFDDYRLHRATLRECEDIDSELRNQIKWLSKHNSSHKYQVLFVDTEKISIEKNADYCDISSSFKMDYARVSRLLIGSKLYRDSLYALRECIQNSIDAISAYKVKNRHLPGLITIQINDTHDTSRSVDIFDNGTGMNKDIIDNYFLSIGSRSYWRTEDFYNKWGNVDDASIIASHGIGVLSYFLIADKIDVFSMYQSNPIHVLLDGQESNVVHLSTEPDNYPKIAMGIATPWEEGHGTCIRMHLKESVSPSDIAYFLLRNIVRASTTINVIINNKKYELNPRWSLSSMDEPTSRRYLSYDQNIEFIFEEFSKDRDPYVLRPPIDKEHIVNLSHLGLEGTMYVSPYNSHSGLIQSRVTQNGILVEDACECIDRLIPELVGINGRIITTYDIDLKGENLFDLDAERTRILDNDFNKEIFDRCLKSQLIDSTIKSIANIENTLYFPCGSSWYHAISSKVEECDNLNIAFHETLNSFLKALILLNEDTRKIFFGAFGKAKLYCILQKKGTSAISACEIIDNKAMILVIPKNRDSYVQNPFGFSPKYCTPDLVLEYVESKGLKAVIMPRYLESFSFPLMDSVNLEIAEDNDKFTGYYLRSSGETDYYLNNLKKVSNGAVLKKYKKKTDLESYGGHFVEVLSSKTTLTENIDLLNVYLNGMNDGLARMED